MPDRAADRKILWISLVIFLACVSLPYLYAAQAAGDSYVYGGALINYQDSNSYMAKLYQGWQGAWTLRLPFTSEAMRPAALFLYHLFLGHLARWSGLSLLVVYHLARLLGAGVLLVSLQRFFRATLPVPETQRIAFLLAAFGSGLGWVLALTGTITSDATVPEAYPFLSAYANAHFPWSLALMLWLLAPSQKAEPAWALWPLALISLALSLISPFGVVVVGVVLAGLLVWQFIQRKAKPEAWTQTLARLLWIGLGGGPYLLYDLWVVRSDPVWAGWNAQNITLSPPIWDLAVSLAPVLLLALLGGWLVVRRRFSTSLDPGLQTLLIWALGGLVLVYLPFELQRRFLTGLYVPLAGLGSLGVVALAGRTRRKPGFWAFLVLLLSAPTLLLILLGGMFGVANHSPLLYLTRDEARALEWIEANTPPDALVLASPGMGGFIPGQTGRRVMYGHPMETVQADAQRAWVEGVYAAPLVQAQAELQERQVDYIFYGPREKDLGSMPETLELEPVFTSGDVAVYALPGYH